MKHHVAVDLDGTLAEYDRWRGNHHIGQPVAAILDRVIALLKDGHEVTIFTSRVAGDWPDHIKDLEQTRRYIEMWCHEHVGRILPVTAIKHGWFTEFWDDKALGVGGIAAVLPVDGNRIGQPELNGATQSVTVGPGDVAKSRPAWAQYEPEDDIPF